MSESLIQQLTAEQREQLEIFYRVLVEENKKLNLTRITSEEEVRVRHFEDSLAALPLLREYAAAIDWLPSLADIGSGGGFPGLVLAVALPDWRMISIEATGKKADFQYRVVEEVGLRNVEVINDRAEELASLEDYRGMFDFATNRAVGNLALIAELSGAFVREGGYFVSYKGPRADEEIIAGRKAFGILGFDEPVQIPYSNFGEEGTSLRLVIAKKLRRTPRKYPRQYNIIKARPLGR
ncbi:MAG: 16S rRNA (guanine(527)-N(7))-methyltransferase RsmG [Phycisphaerae bacterium]|jgi:16S rRNA (guanine527-N7)-methyltransferase